MRHKEIGELTGDSPTRVGQLVGRANMHIYEVLEQRARERPELPPRARRVAELEQRPPRWLVAEIGRPPRVVRRSVGLSETRRAWRRAALALDDLREARKSGRSAPARAGMDREDLAERAARALEALRNTRGHEARRDLGR